MTDPSDTWAAKKRRLNSKTDAVRVRYYRWVMYLTRNEQLPF